MKFEVLSHEPEEELAALRPTEQPLEAVIAAVEVIRAACKDGRQTTNHAEWGYFNEIARYNERITNICAHLKAHRPSGVGPHG